MSVEFRVGAEAEAERAEEAPALRINEVAVGDVLVVIHGDGAGCGRGVDLLVHIYNRTDERVRANGDFSARCVTKMCRLLAKVDRTTRGAHAEAFGRRSLEDVNLLGGKAVADIDAEIAQAIDVEVALGVEAANAELVAVHAAVAFAGRDRDAGNSAQRLIDGGEVLLLDALLADDRDGLRSALVVALEAAHAGARLQRIAGFRRESSRRILRLSRRGLSDRRGDGSRRRRHALLRCGLFAGAFFAVTSSGGSEVAGSAASCALAPVDSIADARLNDIAPSDAPPCSRSSVHAHALPQSS